MHTIIPELLSPRTLGNLGEKMHTLCTILFKDLANSAFLLSSILASKIILFLWAEKEFGGVTTGVYQNCNTMNNVLPKGICIVCDKNNMRS